MQLDMSLLAEFLQARRWFAGKAWPIKSVQIVERVDLGSGADRPMALTVAEVVYKLGTPERYVLALTDDGEGSDGQAPPQGGALKDALETEALARALLQLIVDGSELKSVVGTLRSHTMGWAGERWAALTPATPIRYLNQQQTNTSMVVGDAFMFKIIRKIEQGPNPEVELGSFLTERSFPFAPRLAGWISFSGASESTFALAHELVPDGKDGWLHVLETLRAAGPTPASIAPLLTMVARLGDRVGALHRTLASAPDEPAFAPEPIRTEDLQRWSSSLLGLLGVVLNEVQATVPELARHKRSITERAEGFAHLVPAGERIRIHGDLHLGQVLVTGEDWRICDFEGEPGRKLEQRREKHSPLKDVAGMLRSFHYVEATLEREGRGRPGVARELRAAFLDGYWSATRGTTFIPADVGARDALLDALELERLLYELRYEVTHRPDWVHIPASSLLQEAPR